MERKLAFVAEIKDLKPHPKTDSLEIASVLGWKSIVPKGQYRLDQKIVFIEKDSKLPRSDWCPPDLRGRTIKQFKILGVISEGLILTVPGIDSLPLGKDLTCELNIEKTGNEVGDFPTHLVHKTGELRIQSEPDLLETLTGKPYYISLKYDGMSVTYLIENGVFTVCSHNKRIDSKTSDKTPYHLVGKKYQVKDILEKELGRYAIQGEICGPKINGNRLELTDYQLFVFNVIDLTTKKKIDLSESIHFCSKHQLPMVEILELGDNFNYRLDDLRKFLVGNYQNSKYQKEGIVIRSQQQDVSFKLLNFSR